MHRTMEKMIRRYGTSMILVREEAQWPIRAFLQETQSRSQENMRRGICPIGQVPKGMHVYIGPVSPEAAAGDLIVCGERLYEVQRAEIVMVGDQKAYCWGLCEQKGGDSQWGS